jgi:hypothetical protein
MSSHRPLPLTGQASELEMSFCLDETQFQLVPGFFKAVHCLALPTGAAESLFPHMGFFSSTFCTSPPSRGEISRGWQLAPPAVLEYVVPSQTVCCSHLMG